MLNFFKTIVLAVVVAALAVLFEQAIALAISIFQQKEIIFAFYSHFTFFLAGAAVIEEVLKYGAIFFVLRNNFNSRGGHFIFLSALLGFVWGIFESALVLFSNQNAFSQLQAGNSEIIFSLATVIAIHTLTAFLMGLFISTGTFTGRLKHLKVVIFPVLVHLLFNFLIIQKGDFTNYLIIISIALVFLTGMSILLFNFKKLA